jgi:hypothetical protein
MLILTKRSDDSIITKGWMSEKSCHVNKSSVSITRTDIIAGLPERKISQLYILQLMSRDMMPILKELGMHLGLGQA